MKDLVNKDYKALSSELNSNIKELFNLKIKLVNKDLQNTSSLKKLRKSIARIKTILNNKEF